ncbi:MAG: ATP-binding protein [Bacteroidales bacterium]|nr:ATP-binding protein [Bacteroidales bacterium]
MDSIIGLVRAKEALRKQVQLLKSGSHQTVRGILLMGSSGTGKSTMARCLGFDAGIPIVSLEKIKDSLVGASEDNMYAAIRNIKAIGNCILFIDEVDCYIPNRESHQNTDSGVSSNLLKILFEFMADESNKGKVLFVGATNYPQALDFAMLSRFSLKIPIPPPNIHEIPFHFQKSQYEIIGESTIDVNHPDIIEATQIIWEKGGSDGRIIKDLVSGTDFSPQGILEMARRFTGKPKLHDDIKAELTAYEMTQDKGLFPWYGNPDFTLPWYLKDIVKLESGDYDIVKSIERKRTL